MWLLLDWYDNKKWWLVKDNEIDCTEEQMKQAVEGYFSIESARIVPNKLPTVSGMVSLKVEADTFISNQESKFLKEFYPLSHLAVSCGTVAEDKTSYIVISTVPQDTAKGDLPRISFVKFAADFHYIYVLRI